MDVNITAIDYGDMEGGLTRMMDRFREKGTLTDDVSSDAFIREHPNAALLGLLYDQRMRAEYAFTGPERLHDRLGHLDMQKIADYDSDAFKDKFAEKPAVHRFINKMADTTQEVAGIIADEYDNDAANLWAKDVALPEVRKRVRALPGYGPMKATKVRYVLHYFGHRDFPDEE